MTRTRVLSLLMLGLLAATMLAGCRRHHDQTDGAVQTQTIAPAAAQPAPNDAMTQTVEVEESRSEEDGGVLTQQGQTAAGTATTATTTSAAPKPKPKTKKPK